ncbi:Flp pilus assembly protein CpaB [Endomicrobium proavitum]|uniref:Flp pilus assembly protein CpaB n=1 Tax=Endomicrobium proavitum TaxID=1408281 RepID=A0A0G3WJY1_9BACT|nr:Flp pilus assembly protein CpaB [Endomicrobium proavitum]AKL97814.1 Flp pilus assembly protein CpaB [Endomicrobium proavitum]
MKKTVLLAAVFAVFAALFAFLFFNGIETKYKTLAEPVKVLVANQRIVQGTVIRADMLAVKAVPKEYVQPKAFANASSLFTKDGAPLYIALNAIESGEQILSTKVSQTNSDTGVSSIIPDGKKALVVSFDNDISGITPGSRIDVLSIIEYADTNKQFNEAAYVIAQDILVLAVGENYLGAARKTGEQDSSKKSAVTLSVSIEEAQSILLADERGSLKFVIRPSGDNEVIPVKAVKISDIVRDISKTQSQPQKTQNVSRKETLDILNKYSNSLNR